MFRVGRDVYFVHFSSAYPRCWSLLRCEPGETTTVNAKLVATFKTAEEALRYQDFTERLFRKAECHVVGQ
jgi:hypothetical protein